MSETWMKKKYRDIKQTKKNKSGHNDGRRGPQVHHKITADQKKKLGVVLPTAMFVNAQTGTHRFAKYIK